MLARTRSIHIYCSLHHVVDALLDLLPLFRDRPVVNDTFVEVTVADMAEDTCKQPHVVHLLLADLDEVRQTAEGDSDIGTPYAL